MPGPVSAAGGTQPFTDEAIIDGLFKSREGQFSPNLPPAGFLAQDPRRMDYSPLLIRQDSGTRIVIATNPAQLGMLEPMVAPLWHGRLAVVPFWNPRVNVLGVISVHSARRNDWVKGIEGARFASLGGLQNLPGYSFADLMVATMVKAEDVTPKWWHIDATRDTYGGQRTNLGGAKGGVKHPGLTDSDHVQAMYVAGQVAMQLGLWIAGDDQGMTRRSDGRRWGTDFANPAPYQIMGVPGAGDGFDYVGMGDPSPYTALGVIYGIETIQDYLLGTKDTLIFLEGIGGVGWPIYKHLLSHAYPISGVIEVNMDNLDAAREQARRAGRPVPPMFFNAAEAPGLLGDQFAAHLARARGAGDVIIVDSTAEAIEKHARHTVIFSPNASAHSIDAQLARVLVDIRAKAIYGAANNQIKPIRGSSAPIEWYLHKGGVFQGSPDRANQMGAMSVTVNMIGASPEDLVRHAQIIGGLGLRYEIDAFNAGFNPAEVSRARVMDMHNAAIAAGEAIGGYSPHNQPSLRPPPGTVALLATELGEDADAIRRRWGMPPHAARLGTDVVLGEVGSGAERDQVKRMLAMLENSRTMDPLAIAQSGLLFDVENTVLSVLPDDLKEGVTNLNALLGLGLQADSPRGAVDGFRDGWVAFVELVKTNPLLQDLLALEGTIFRLDPLSQEMKTARLRHLMELLPRLATLDPLHLSGVVLKLPEGELTWHQRYWSLEFRTLQSMARDEVLRPHYGMRQYFLPRLWQAMVSRIQFSPDVQQLLLYHSNLAQLEIGIDWESDPSVAASRAEPPAEPLADADGQPLNLKQEITTFIAALSPTDLLDLEIELPLESSELTDQQLNVLFILEMARELHLTDNSIDTRLRLREVSVEIQLRGIYRDFFRSGAMHSIFEDPINFVRLRAIAERALLRAAATTDANLAGSASPGFEPGQPASARAVAPEPPPATNLDPALYTEAARFFAEHSISANTQAILFAQFGPDLFANPASKERLLTMVRGQVPAQTVAAIEARYAEHTGDAHPDRIGEHGK